jgi:hypothetical protein
MVGSGFGKLEILHTTLLESEVNVHRGHRAFQGEVLEDGGDEEQFIVGDAFTKTNALPFENKGSVLGRVYQVCQVPFLSPDTCVHLQ